VNRLGYREEREGERREIYIRAVGYLIPYQPYALTSAQLKLSSVRSMPHVSHGASAKCNSTIDCATRTRAAHDKLPVDPCTTRSL